MKKKRSPHLDDELLPEYGAELFRNMKPGRVAGVELQLKGRRAVAAESSAKTVKATVGSKRRAT